MFCKIIKGEILTEIIYKDEDVIAFPDRNPQAPVHILIIPTRHIEFLREATENDKELLGKILLTAKKIAEDHQIGESGYRVLTNVGPNAGQTVNHMHFHLIGGKHLG